MDEGKRRCVCVCGRKEEKREGAERNEKEKEDGANLEMERGEMEGE